MANNNHYREIELFIPLNRSFSFCDEVNRLLKYIPFEIVLSRIGNNSHCYYGANNTAIDFGGDESVLISIVFQLERIKLRADISSDMETMYKRPFNVSYYKRICEQSANQAGCQSTFSCVCTFNNEDDGNPRYLFVLIKHHANDTAQTNYQRCCHANISSITARYNSNTYILLPQSADWSRNQYSRLYIKFIRLSKSLGNSNLGLSMQEFRDLYTIYVLDLSAQAVASKNNQLTM